LLSVSATVFSQETFYVDSLKKDLSKTTDVIKKISIIERISQMLMVTDREAAERYGKEAIELAERSRDREAMVKAYLANGSRCTNYIGVTDYASRAANYLEEAQKIAKEGKLTKYEVSALMKKVVLQLGLSDKEKAGRYLGQAISLSATLNDDSLQSKVSLLSGDVHLAKNEKIEALRSYLNGLRLSEKINNVPLKSECYTKLSSFYSSIEDYDKAIDYYSLGMKTFEAFNPSKAKIPKIQDLYTIGNLYARQKKYELALKYFEESIQLADSLQFPSLKVSGYVGLLNVYIMMEQPTKSLQFMNSEKGAALKKYLTQIGMSPVIDQAYAIIYSEMRQLDSAGKYFNIAAPFFNNSQNPVMKMSYKYQNGIFLKRNGDNTAAINLFLTTKSLSDSLGQLELALESSKYLDTLYALTGDYKQSKFYSAASYVYKDSLQKINKEKELTQIEAQDEQLRQQRMADEAAEKKRQRNNIQYLAITIGIVTLFLVMVLLGMFSVSARTIKLLGFFTFLMFFEFIFLLFKKNIYAITQGEPWMDLMFMILLAAFLLPLHHWLEHKALHYLTTQNKLTSAGSAFRSRFLMRKSTNDKTI